MPTPPTDETPRPPRWPWLLLAASLVWAVLLRVPIVLNAPAHLDSDLAVDGLTLLDAVHGHPRWHYPGTPYIGALPLLASLPQALLFSANPATLVSGGTILALGLIVATFFLAWRAFGPEVAGWSLVPLTFASTGALWLSARITGGHLLTAAWHAAAFAILHGWLTRGGLARAARLGLWCGLGLYVDSMFLTTLAGLIPAALLGRRRSSAGARPLAEFAILALAFLAGVAPRELGARLEPYDAYKEQFQPIREPAVLLAHGRILSLECLPRLVSGHRLDGFASDPDPASLAGPAPVRSRTDAHPTASLTCLLGLTVFAASTLALGLAAVFHRNPATRAVCAGLLVSMLTVTLGFVLNRNIFNSDNYRYLVTWLVPEAIGFGLVLHWFARRGQGGLTTAVLAASLFATLLTWDAARWYSRFGWIDGRGLPVRRPLDDPALAWLEARPEVSSLFGGYWDVYRLAFLTAGRVRGIPSSIYPDRFPEWGRELPGGHPRFALVRTTPEGLMIRLEVLRRGGRAVDGGRGFEILSWP